MEKLRWGVIGCGEISSKGVIPALRELERCELQAVARANATLVESYAQEVGAKRWFNDWKSLIESKEVDAVYVAAPVNIHEQQVVAATVAGKHVLCVKPMAMNA